MNMTGYTKLFNSILCSTIWRADDKTRIVWITLLALAGKDGIAEGSIPGLADMARVSIEDCERALNYLMSPDQYSRTKDHEGRRISEIDGGWLILNHKKFRSKMSVDEKREYDRVKQAEHRERKSNNVKNVNDTSLTPSVYGDGVASGVQVPEGGVGETAVELPPGFPKTEEAAVAACMTCGIPEASVRSIWKLAAGRGGRDSKDVPIRNFAVYAQGMAEHRKGVESERRQVHPEMRTSAPKEELKLKHL